MLAGLSHHEKAVSVTPPLREKEMMVLTQTSAGRFATRFKQTRSSCTRRIIHEHQTDRIDSGPGGTRVRNSTHNSTTAARKESCQTPAPQPAIQTAPAAGITPLRTGLGRLQRALLTTTRLAISFPVSAPSSVNTRTPTSQCHVPTFIDAFCASFGILTMILPTRTA
jgi:hypothetical protein